MFWFLSSVAVAVFAFWLLLIPVSKKLPSADIILPFEFVSVLESRGVTMVFMMSVYLLKTELFLLMGSLISCLVLSGFRELAGY